MLFSSFVRRLVVALVSAATISMIQSAEAQDRILTRLFIQDLDSQSVRWSEVRRVANGKFSLSMPQPISGWQTLDAAKQRLVQMQETGNWIAVGVCDRDGGKFQSGWQLMWSGVSGSTHGDHSHWHYSSAPRVVDKRLDDKQGNPTHVDAFDRAFYIANDQIHGYTKIDPARYNAATNPRQFAAIPRFIPGGGNHLSLAIVGERVGYAGWIDGDSKHKGRVDVTRIGPNQAEIAYSFHLPSGDIHGAAVLEGRVYFSAADGVYHVPVDATASLSADKVQPVHISLGKDDKTDKPLRTDALATLGKYVVFTIGREDNSTLGLLNATDPKSPLVKLPLNAAAGQSASKPVVVKTRGDQRLAFVFHENRSAPEGRPDGESPVAQTSGSSGGSVGQAEAAAKSETASSAKPAAESLAIINLDPNGDKNFAHAKIVKTLSVGANKIRSYFGHHGMDFDADRRFAFLTNPGDATLSILDLEKLEIVGSFKIGGAPSHIIATGGEQCDH